MAFASRAPDDSAEKAYIACIRLLGRREYSKAELLRKLKLRFTPEAARQAVVGAARARRAMRDLRRCSCAMASATAWGR